MGKSKSKSKAKRFRSKVVKGAQQSLPGIKAPAKRVWNKEWGSPLIAVRTPAPLASAWKKWVGKRNPTEVFHQVIAKACGFNLKALRAEAK